MTINLMATERPAVPSGEVVNFPKAKRPLPAADEDGEQPNLRALARAALVRLGKAAPCGASDEHDGDTPDAA